MAPNIEDPKMNKQDEESSKNVVLTKVGTKVRGWSQKAAASTASGLKKLAPDDFREEIDAIKSKFVKTEKALPEAGKPIPVDQLPKAPLKSRILQTGSLLKKTLEETLAVKKNPKDKLPATPKVTVKTIVLDKSDAPKLSKTPPAHADKKDPLPVYPPKKVIVTLEESSSDIAEKSAVAKAHGLREYTEPLPLALRASGAVAKGREIMAKGALKTREALQVLNGKIAQLSTDESKAQRKALAADAKGAFLESAKGVAQGLGVARVALEKRVPLAKPVFESVGKGAQNVGDKLRGLKESEGLTKVKEKIAKTSSSASQGIKKAAETANERIAEIKKKAAEKAPKRSEKTDAPETEKAHFDVSAATEKVRGLGAKASESAHATFTNVREKFAGKGEGDSVGEKLKGFSERATESLKEQGAKLKDLSGKAAENLRGSKLKDLSEKAAESLKEQSAKLKDLSGKAAENLRGSKLKDLSGKASEGLKSFGQSAKEKIASMSSKPADSDSGSTSENAGSSLAEKLKSLGGKISDSAKVVVEKTREKAEKFMDTDDSDEGDDRPSLSEKFKDLGEKFSKGAKGLAENARAKAQSLRHSEKGEAAENAVKETVKDVLPSETIVDVKPEDVTSEEDLYAASETIDAKIMNGEDDADERDFGSESSEAFQKQDDSAYDNRNFRNNRKRRHH